MQLITYTSIIIINIIIYMSLFKIKDIRALNCETGMLKVEKYRYSKTLIIIFTLVLIFVSTYRHGFIDTSDYIWQYKIMNVDFTYGRDALMDIEKGWLVILYVLNKFSSDPRLMLFVCATVINIAYVKQIVKYSEDVPFSLYLYYIFVYLGTNNGMRQVFAASILLLAFKWILDNNYIKFILLVLLLSLIHKSVLVCIPIYFIIRGRGFNIGIISFIAISIITLLKPDLVFGIIVAFLGDDSYTKYLLSTNATMGALRLIIGGIPCILSICYYRIEKNKGNKISKKLEILTNSTFINFGLLIMSLKMVYFARISIYYDAYVLMAIPILINRIFTGKNAKFIKIMAVLFYAIYFWFQLKAYGDYLNYFYLEFS